MNNDDSTRIRFVLDRLRQGDPDASKQLINETSDRLCWLFRTILHKEFPRLEAAHESGSILSEATLRLMTSLQDVKPATPEAFFGFASLQIRRVLIDLARHHDLRMSCFEQPEPVLNGVAPADDADEPIDPAANSLYLAMWTEFHQKVDQLPQDERQVVDLFLYQGFRQSETAGLLGIHSRAVSRLWQRALLRLSDFLPGWTDREE